MVFLTKRKSFLTLTSSTSFLLSFFNLSSIHFCTLFLKSVYLAFSSNQRWVSVTSAADVRICIRLVPAESLLLKISCLCIYHNSYSYLMIKTCLSMSFILNNGNIPVVNFLCFFGQGTSFRCCIFLSSDIK